LTAINLWSDPKEHCFAAAELLTKSDTAGSSQYAALKAGIAVLKHWSTYVWGNRIFAKHTICAQVTKEVDDNPDTYAPIGA
jgi:hypothetical protein